MPGTQRVNCLKDWLKNRFGKGSGFLLWAGVLLLLTLSAALAIVIEKPVGSLSGKIVMEQAGFGIATADVKGALKGKKVYAIAVGPRRSNTPIERGVWVKDDGSFEIKQLPVGEYTLRLRAPGYATENRNGVFIDEGRVTNLSKLVVMHPLEPSVTIASNSRVFTQKEAPGFWINTNGASDATVKIYRADVLSLLKMSDKQRAIEFGGDLSIYRPYGKNSEQAKNIFAKQKPVAVFRRHLEDDGDDWAHVEFKFSNPLPLGDYIAVSEVVNESLARAGKNSEAWNLMWFNVSDIGLVMKQAPDKWVARAIDLNTLKPLSGVQVNLLDRDHAWQSLGVAATDKNGLVEIPLKDYNPNTYGYSLLAYATASGKAFKPSHTYGGIQYWRYDADDYQTYFYTERPVYRLGQTVYFKGIVRKKDKTPDNYGGFLNPGANLAVSVLVSDPDNNKLAEFSTNTTAHGSFHGVVEIPEDGKTGAYQLTLTYPDGTRDYENFEVAQYRKPEYQVEVQPLQTEADKPVIAGQSVKARIRATYYFGAPVANAVVKYSIYAKPDWARRYQLMPRPSYYAYFDDWEESDYGYDGAYAGEYIEEGYAQTDEAGEALITFKTRPVNSASVGPYDFEPADKRYKIQAEVTDLSRMSVMGSSSFAVSAGEFALFVQSARSVYKAGESASVVVSARDYAGKPLANQPVTLQLFRWVWDEAKEEYRNEAVTDASGATDFETTTRANGDVRLRISLKDALSSDTYFISAQSKDAQGNTIRERQSVWIANAHSPYMLSGQESEKQPLSVTLDKPVYQPGDTARLMISAPTSGKDNMAAWVSLEGKTLHRHIVVPLKSTAQLVEIPVPAKFAPNAYVSVAVVGKKKQYYYDSKILRVSPEANFMRLAVTTAKTKYHPGDSVDYVIQATDMDGRPVANAEVSLGVVDESIYSIRLEATTPIEKFFYRKIENDVLTLTSFPEQYSAGPDKIEPRIRKDFRDMAAWFPSLLTDAQGLARASVKLPDNLTSWRATARAISGTVNEAEALTPMVLVGETTQSIVSTQDLILRLALPRFYTQGDEALVTAVLHNYTGKPQPVQLSLAMTNLDAAQSGRASLLQLQNPSRNPLSKNLTLTPEQALRVQWPIKAISPGKIKLLAKAVATKSAGAGDALEQTVSVLPLGVPQTWQKTWVLEKENDLLNTSLELPKGVNPQEAMLTLSASASPIGSALGNLESLVDYPYGCTEQTMSRLVPAAVVLKLQRALNLPVSESLKNKISAVQNKAFGILRDHQNGDGGWGWWQNDTSSFMMSAYVLEQNLLLNEAGMSLPDEQARAGVDWLAQQEQVFFAQLRDPKRVIEKASGTGDLELQIDFAQGQAVLSAYGRRTPQPVLTWAKSQLAKLPPEALSYWVIALSRQHDASAELFLKQLLALANRTSPDTANAQSGIALMDWDHTPALMSRLKIRNNYTYRYTGIESTVLALKAMIASRQIILGGSVSAGEGRSTVLSPMDVESVKNWLLLQRGSDGWDNTKTTAQVLSVLADEEISDKSVRPTAFTAWLTWLASSHENDASVHDASIHRETSNREIKLAFDAKNQYQGERRVWMLTLAELGLHDRHPKGLLNIKKEGPGRFYLAQWLRYMLPLKPGQPVRLAAYPQGLSIRREFFRLKPTIVDNFGTVRFSLEPLNSGPLNNAIIKSGESLLMQTRIQSPVALPYVMVNAPLPSGGEIVSEDPRMNLLATSQSDSDAESDNAVGGAWGFMDWWWTHQDILDDRIVFFSTKLPAGESKFQAIVRMEMPGKLQLNPVSISAMYQPGVKAYSELDQLQVSD
ncbi:MAG: MG2 domain-containing protein [Vampirovibrionales bacterium]|nr:MG2 domain-containing protein [Vampirovibrionales bacterium]